MLRHVSAFIVAMCIVEMVSTPAAHEHQRFITSPEHDTTHKCAPNFTTSNKNLKAEGREKKTHR